MFDNLRHVLLEVGNDIIEVLTVCLREFVLVVLNNLSEVFKKFLRHLTEVDHEVQRVLDLMGYARAQNS